MSGRRPSARDLVLGLALASAISGACGGLGLSKDQAKPFVALSLSGDTDLSLAAFTGAFCESDDGRRLRRQATAGAAVPSNAYAFGRMAESSSLKTLVANGYVELKEETLAPDAAEASHPSCGKRDICRGCPVISKYYVAMYRLTQKGKDLFLETPVSEEEYVRLYNSGAIAGPFDDVQQAFGDDMPMRISLVIASKAFDVTGVTTDSTNKTAQVNYEWYWKPSSRIEKTGLQQLIPKGRSRATVQLKQLDDGWHLERDASPAAE